jgi:hypothetical protein
VIASRLRIGFAILALFVASRPAAGQTPLGASLISQTSSRDSIDARKRALRAQNNFEMVRRFNLPKQYTSLRQNCDAHIGRFCQWNEGDQDPPKEPAPIRDAREDLIRTLEAEAARSPGDDWIAGQLIRYLLEAGRDSAAVRAAVACAGTRWWCDALRGLALHEAGAGAAADSAFNSALAAMPERERCRWTDMTVLLDPAQRKRYGKVGCGRREELAARLWWLADPFLALPGNDRQAEHYSRHMMSRILAGTRAGYDVRWGDDLRELVVRYGWSRYWTVSPPSSSLDTRQGTISGHEASPNYHFFPTSLVIDSASSIGDSTWSLKHRFSPERYSPRVAPLVDELVPQIALFRRGDSVQVVAAYDVSRDTAYVGGTVRSALVLARDERDQPVVSELALPRGWHSVTIDDTPRVLSIETWNPQKKRGARLRQGLWLPRRAANSIAVSDILLFDASPDVSDLASILPHSLGSLTVARDRKLGVYWEAYGLARPDSALPVSLTLTRMEGGLRRLAQAIGLGKRSSPLSIAWRETPSMGGIASRSVVLDLSLIPRGRYKLKLELTPSSSPPVSAGRIIEIK